MAASDVIVSNFMLQACRQDRRSNMRSVYALMARVDVRQQMKETSSLQSPNSRIPFTLSTGSVAEMYIEPAIPCVADMDTMYYYTSKIAFPGGKVVTPVIVLPAEFKDENEIQWLTICGDATYPGYVYLQVAGLMISDGNCQFLTKGRPEDSDEYLPNWCSCVANLAPVASAYERTIHGPALTVAKVTHEDYFGGDLKRDLVQCMRCPAWPPQAASWPTRRRYHGWPDTATVECIVDYGCHLVSAVHHHCRQDSWKSKYQWRLSFSKAEVVLLNSWTPVQQIVYHMLRIFLKKSELSLLCIDQHGDKILTNYNIKTLMLWAVENKQWKEKPNLINVCKQLLRTLATWMKNADCRQYFVQKCNVFEWTKCDAHQEKLAARFAALTNETLSNWFVQNYIKESVKHESCQLRSVSALSDLFVNISTPLKLETAVNSVAAHCSNELKYRDFLLLDDALSWFAVWFNPPTLPPSLHVETYDFLKAELPKLDSRLCECLDGVFALHVASHIERRQISVDELVDATLSRIVGVEPEMQHKLHCKHFLSVATDLLKHSNGNNHHNNTLTLMQTELAKAYLYRALNGEDSSCVAHVYLSALHYNKKEYYPALNHCTHVTSRQDHTRWSSVAVEGDIFPFIDNDISIVLGLVVLYEHVQATALNRESQTVQRQQQLRPVFTAKFFAFYLKIKCLIQTTAAADSRSNACEYELWKTWEQYRLLMTSKTSHPLLTDILLYRLISEHRPKAPSFFISPFQRHAPGFKFTTPELYRLLTVLAIERLTIYREIQHREFCSDELDVDIAVITSEFQTMYDIKCKKYDQSTCMQNTYRIFWAFTSPSIPILPTFLPLLDDTLSKFRPSHRPGKRFFRLQCFTLSHYWEAVCAMNVDIPILEKSRLLTFILRRIQSALSKTSEYMVYDQEVLENIYIKAQQMLDRLDQKLNSPLGHHGCSDCVCSYEEN